MLLLFTDTGTCNVYLFFPFSFLSIKAENIFTEENYPFIPPIREDSHCYLLDHSCDESLGGESDEEIAGENHSISFRSNLSKIRGKGLTGKDEEEQADQQVFWRDSVLTESGRCASCTNLILNRGKKGGKFEKEDSLSAVVDRDSYNFNVGCLPSCSSRGPKMKCSNCHSSKPAKGGAALQANNWCCGVGVIATTVKQKTKKLE